MSMRIHCVIIDPQRSFCANVPANEQQVKHDGELCVAGGWDDMVRVSNMIQRLGKRLNQIHITLDSHHQWHIAHPCWFKDTKGNAPAPFTMMKENNGTIIGSTLNLSTGNWVEQDEYTPVLMGETLRWTYQYLRELQKLGKHPHIIWPYHVQIGTKGHNIVEPLIDSVLEWELIARKPANKITKGSCPYVEHFSAVRAEVPYPKDPSTQLNTDFVQLLAHEADEVLICGEALSHCVANTFLDVANELGDEFVKKCVLLTDGSSPVTNFESYGEEFIKQMTNRGMRTTTTEDYLK